MLMTAHSSGGGPQWTRRSMPGVRARQTSRSAGSLAAIAGFMAPARRSDKHTAAKSEQMDSPGSNADEEEVGVHTVDDEWEDVARGEEEEEQEEEVVAFRDAQFLDDDDSEYAPSGAEEDDAVDLDEEEESAAGLFAAYLPRRRHTSNKLGISRSLVLPPRSSGKSSSDSDDGAFSEQDARLWASAEEKQQWASQYRAKDRAFRRSFGCAIDSHGRPEVRRRLQRERSLRPLYVAVILALLALYSAQLTGLSPASLLSSVFTAGISWRSGLDQLSGVDSMDEAINHFDAPLEDVESDVASGEHAAMDRVSPSAVADEDSDEVLHTLGDHSTPSADYSKAASDLCGQLLYRVVTSRHDAKVIQNAASACDIATKLSPLGSLRLTVAYAQRGDLRSLLGEFDAADEDYAISRLGLLSIVSAGTQTDALAVLERTVEAKTVANRWIQLYVTRDTDALVREVVQAAGATDDSPAPGVEGLAADWLQVFKREKAVIDAVTGLRMWTLRRLDDAAPTSTR